MSVLIPKAMISMIVMSKCLAGFNCKYSGGNNCVPTLKKLYEEGKAVLVCPEQLGGLSTPRPASEIQKEKVINIEGTDVTRQYKEGSEKALAIAKKNGCTKAILKANSPACGVGHIYDGTFTHTLTKGNGTFAALLIRNNISCMTEKEGKEE